MGLVIIPLLPPFIFYYMIFVKLKYIENVLLLRNWDTLYNCLMILR